jgi:hypothetical protein
MHMRMRTLSTVLMSVLAGCAAKRSDQAASTSADDQTRNVKALDEGAVGKPDVDRPAGAGAAVAPAAPPALDRAQNLEQAKQEGQFADGRRDSLRAQGSAAPAEHKANARGGKDGGGGGETATRAWFPETFLFEPLVVTDDHGDATVPVRVPDRLTTWRVLALAHSRTGAQGGAVTSFLGTLPTYIDPIVPKRLIVGDQVRLPIQLVNTTAAAVPGTLAITGDGVTISGAAGARTIPAEGSLVDYATLSAGRAGAVSVRAQFGAGSPASAGDAVVRGIEVSPAGKPVLVTRSGTLAAPRELHSDGIPNDDAATDRVHLVAFPGALALLRNELVVSTARSGASDDAYALLLAGRAPQLLALLGDKPDDGKLREAAIVVGQRAMRDGRTLDVATASLLVEPALAHPNNPVLARLGERAAAWLAQNQRPDGTFAGGTGWTLQRVLVASADAARAVGAATGTQAARQRAAGVQARAAGVFERDLGRVEDPYTAAAILASGALVGDSVTKLKKLVRDHVATGSDGAKYLDAGRGVVRGDGAAPSRALTTALAVLALKDDPADAALVADLGATLLGSYAPATGWGDGVDNLACIQAVVALFKDPVPANVTVRLEMDGKPVAVGVLSPDKLKDVMTLDAPVQGLASAHTWRVVSEPAVPGLGFSLSLEGHVPWTPETGQGIELAVTAPKTAKVGVPADVVISAAAPAGLAQHVRLALPAGVQVDRPSVEALQAAGSVTRFEIEDGVLELWLAALSPGQTFTGSVRVIPTLAGTLHAPASSIETTDGGGPVVHVPPVAWTISG